MFRIACVGILVICGVCACKVVHAYRSEKVLNDISDTDRQPSEYDIWQCWYCDTYHPAGTRCPNSKCPSKK